jgi:hypothetical protein
VFELGPVGRPLHFVLIVDGSERMAEDNRIHALNGSIRELIPYVPIVAGENPNHQV